MGERWSPFLEKGAQEATRGGGEKESKNLKSDVVCNVATLLATSAILFIIYKMAVFLQIGDSGIHMRITCSKDICQFNRLSLRNFL